MAGSIDEITNELKRLTEETHPSLSGRIRHDARDGNASWAFSLFDHRTQRTVYVRFILVGNRNPLYYVGERPIGADLEMALEAYKEEMRKVPRL